MKWFSSIKTKMTALLLGMMFLSLVIAALFFVYRLAILQQQAAYKVLSGAHLQARHTFDDMERRLRDVGRAIASDESVIAGVGLIVNYEDRDDYQPLIFDPAKQELANLLQRNAGGADIEIAVIYDGQGEPVAFYLPSEVGQVSGYFQYEKGVARMVYTSGQEQTLRPPLFLKDAHDVEHGREMGGPHLHVSDDGSLLYDLYLPIADISSTQGEGEASIIRLGYMVDKGVMENIASRADAGVHLRYGDTVLLAGGAPNISPYIEESPLLSEELKQAVEHGELYWDEFSSGGMSFMRGVTRYDVADKGSATLSFVQDSETLSFGIAAMQDTLLWLLPLIAVVLVPVGQLFANHTITSPVRKLIEISSRLGQGQFETIEPFKGTGELAQLAASFNAMSKTLELREGELKDSRAQFENIINNAPAIIYMKDLSGRYLLVNGGYEKFVGKSEAEILGSTDFDHFPQEVAAKVRDNERFVIERREPLEFEEKVTHPDGTVHTYLSVRFPLKNDVNEVVALCGISTDVTERKKIEQNLTLSRLVIENANEAIVITDLDGNIVEVNEAYERIVGFTRDEVIGRNPKITKSGRHDAAFYKKMWHDITTTGRWEGEIWDRRKSGEIFPKWLSITTVFDEAGKASHYVAIFADITTKKQTEEQLEKLAYYDPLTELPNRMYFHEQLRKTISISGRREDKTAVLFLDLDRFKYVNDTLGHSAGDALLVKVAERLQWLTRESDTVSRLGGDEFTIILRGLDRTDQVASIAQNVVDALAQPFEVVGAVVHIGASVGVSVFPDDGSDADTLIKNADLAMYQAKERGKNCYNFYSLDMQDKLNQRLLLEEELRQAIEREEFVVYYQPKVDIATGRVTGMEALVRWFKPDGTMVSPSEFIPVAEETGLIVPMGKWILGKACQQTAQWNQRYGLSLKVAVNLSARQFQDEDVITMVDTVSRDAGLKHHLLELEITESMVMGSVDESIATMEKLRGLGVSLAIDDFGTGYSSLNYLKRFPINTLKIDQSFIRDLHESSEDASIVRAIISMAHSLELSVVAEGVETAAQLAFLHQHACETAQGFYLHRPLCSDDFEKLVSTGPQTL